MIPSLLLYTVFIIMPVFVTIYYSFMKFTGVGRPAFIGIRNYINLFRDPFFFTALKNTCIISRKRTVQGNGFFALRDRTDSGRGSVGVHSGPFHGIN